MDELQRYIAYLQQSRSTPGWQVPNDPQRLRGWIIQNRARMEDLAAKFGGDAEVVNEFERQLSEFQPASEFDAFTAKAIFEPVLREVLAAASECSLAPSRKVVFCNDTDVSPSAAVIPSSSEHLLFAGVGTYAFCNY